MVIVILGSLPLLLQLAILCEMGILGALYLIEKLEKLFVK
jgi:hypothetical protein